MTSDIFRKLAGALGMVCLAVSHGPVLAQPAFPDKVVRIVVGFPPGGTDAAARFIGDRLGQKWKQPVIIDNRPGAGGTTAAAQVAKAAPDGYTLMVSPQTSMVIAPAVYARVGYDSLKDFTPITNIGSSPQILVVRADSPIRTLADLKTLARNGPVTYGSGGNATSLHLAGALLAERMKLDLTHVPYRGETLALTDLLGGQIQMMFSNPPQSIEFIRSGRLRAIAVTSARRLDLLPDVPTVAESGLSNFDTATWIGVFGPAKMPPAVLHRISQDIAAILHDPEAREYWQKQGVETIGDTPEAFGAFIRTELPKWKKIVTDTKIEAN